jgi:predicted DNA-binding protein with PD1-like motif
MIGLQQMNPSGARTFFGTLTDGEDVHAALCAIARAKDIGAGRVDLLGGLTHATLTAYDFTTRTRHAPLVLQGAIEIAHAHGTLSLLNAAPMLHLHAVLAVRDSDPAQGSRVYAGHVAAASAFAVEFILTAYDDPPVSRAEHPGTGLSMWQLPGFE